MSNWLPCFLPGLNVCWARKGRLLTPYLPSSSFALTPMPDYNSSSQSFLSDQTFTSNGQLASLLLAVLEVCAETASVLEREGIL